MDVRGKRAAFTAANASCPAPIRLAAHAGPRLAAWRLADGTMLQESAARLAFLAGPHDTLTCPPGSIQRAQQDAWTNDALECLDAPLMIVVAERAASPDPAPDPSVAAGAHERVSRGLAVWSGRRRRSKPGRG